MEKESKRPPSFKILVPGDENRKQLIFDKLQKIRNIIVNQINHPVNNADILDKVFDEYLSRNENSTSQGASENKMDLNTYSQVDKKDSNQQLFITAENLMAKLLRVVENHSTFCPGHFSMQKLTMKGHVGAVPYTCDKDKHHSMLWSSSPYLPNQEYLVNNKVFHAFTCSGMLPIHYKRFSNGANIGHIDKSKRSLMFSRYTEHIENEYKSSIDTALHEEIGMYDNLTGINIVTDARHGWRKNAKDSSVVAIGEKIHKVITCQHITKTDDRVSQRHEKIGTERVYRYLENKDVEVEVHAHDRNASINKYVREKENTVNQNDPWHAIKAVKIAMKKVSSGAKYMHNKSWGDELDDKVESVATHFHWAIRNCKQNCLELKNLLLNVVEHYKNNHAKCHPDSRCKRDPIYEPKRIVLTREITEKLLLGVIKNSVVFKHPEDYILAKDTHYVESFNNTMNVFQDKRISFSDANYKARSDLAVCHWNENVDRDFTSVWIQTDEMP